MFFLFRFAMFWIFSILELSKFFSSAGAAHILKLSLLLQRKVFLIFALCSLALALSYLPFPLTLVSTQSSHFHSVLICTPVLF